MSASSATCLAHEAKGGLTTGAVAESKLVDEVEEPEVEEVPEEFDEKV
jgi:hypothetical protein